MNLRETIQLGIGLQALHPLVLWRTAFIAEAYSVDHGVCPLSFWLSNSWFGLEPIALIAQNSIIPLNLLEAK
jgi:hypothetical protein